MISRFFIEHPIFATVISILIVILGIVSLLRLPIEQYPNITPPQIQVTATYPGADAATVAQSIAAPLEEQINGVENMIYMYSQSSSQGNMSLSVFFDIGSNADMAQVNVQNRVDLAMPQIPVEVQRLGVNVQKQSTNILLVVAMQSEDPRYDDIYVSNYATINVVDEILRIPGVSNANVVNARDYSMRIWLRPDKMAQLGFTTTDILTAIREQNSEFGVGVIGQPPMPGKIPLTIPVRATGKLVTVEDFENIIIRAEPDGAIVYVKDIGSVELGAQNYDVGGRLNDKEASLIAVYLQYGSNALSVAEKVKARMKELELNFPAGIVYSIPYDTTLFVYRSINEVFITLLEAAVLVALVVFIFLQNPRATLIPVVAMIVSIVGTFAGMYVLGFSINTLTLFGLILAVGIVVDDAIVVIENVERNIREHGIPPLEAAKIAMDEVTGPIIATSIVLCAVFVPVAFIGGIAGQLYQQFAVTIAVSVLISTIVALTLSPALAALLLKKNENPSKFAVYFNRGFDAFRNWYLKAARFILDHAKSALLFFLGCIALLVYLWSIVPSSFVPQEDQGYLINMITMPDASSLSRTTAFDSKVAQTALKDDGVKNVVSLIGYSLLDGLNMTYLSTDFFTLEDWDKRKTKELQASAIQQRLNHQFSDFPEGRVAVFNPPAIQGIGVVGGFEFWLENRGNFSLDELENYTADFIAKASERPELSGLTTTFKTDNLQFFVDLDRSKAKTLAVDIGDVYQTLQVLLGSYYINDFYKYGRVFKVTAQADPRFRSTLSDFGEMYVRANDGNMVPLKSLIRINYVKGSNIVSRFNGFFATRINGSASPGYSSGQAMTAMEEVAREVLPQGFTFSWGGESYQEKTTGGTTYQTMLGGLLVVYLILSALYERWSYPLVIIIGVPFGILGAILAIWLRGISNDVYFQVGLVTLIALVAKNAILIVEFALMRRKEGKKIFDSTIDAAGMRFRAILMTSLTFILGVWPLVVSQGAGAMSRHSVGTGVMGGMIVATFFGVLFTPLFYKLIAQMTEKDNEN